MSSNVVLNPEHRAPRPSGRAAAVLCALALLGGCSTLRGTPPRHVPAEAVVTEINLTAADLASLVNSDSQNNRNEIQKRAIAVIDLRFQQFVRDLSADRADSSAAAAGTTLGASTAGAFVESVKAKTNYALFAAGIVGAFAIVDKNYFYEKTVPALVAAMGAARANVLVRMRTSQRQPIEDYDGAAAMADLEDYFAAGTVLSAISEITTRAEQDRKLALAEVRELDVPTDEVITARKRVTNAIFAIKTDEQLKKANQALRSMLLPEAKTPKQALDALRDARKPPTPAREAAVTKALKDAGLLN